MIMWGIVLKCDRSVIASVCKLLRSAVLTIYSATLKTTGGYASFLNRKVERPHRTIADMTRAL
jgi:hypothetical protein